MLEILKIMVVFAGKIVYNNKAESLGKIRKSKADAMNLDIRAGEPCAAAGREPCQAGNRAALTGVSLCDAASCPFVYQAHDAATAACLAFHLSIGKR